MTWPAQPLDPFFNANTMDDIAEAERLARSLDRRTELAHASDTIYAASGTVQAS